VGVVVRKGRKADSGRFLRLLLALARYERLHPPSPAGMKRIVQDIFERKRLSLFVASDGRELVGYALYFYTYSSFLAKPTLYLEDLFVLEGHRGRGAGLKLFRRCVEEAVHEGCGRMEWAVLRWNEKAIRFYEKMGARPLKEWSVYRLDEKGLRKARSAGT
jgi:GNAT superfamily N-acetyltransferase